MPGNDTDPDGDRLYLENASSPRRGEVCDLGGELRSAHSVRSTQEFWARR